MNLKRFKNFGILATIIVTFISRDLAAVYYYTQSDLKAIGTKKSENSELSDSKEKNKRF